MSKLFSVDEVAKHASKADLYMIIHKKVYDVSTFVEKHPGGEEILTDVGGRDTTEEYDDAGHSEKADRLLKKLYIGEVDYSAVSQPVGKPLRTDNERSGHITSTRSLGFILAFLVAALALVFDMLSSPIEL
ncbi:Cytochrome b5 heme-binding domain-containing protein [Trichoderma simmonsii]|uniref:Cytochrome b5 heme-binding domain-containing protein n=1 Tax=Trichoderma simmonsii TaxID=1491479 RepID=A0A8G0LSZ4_9HYPO|nr:Cytochrome b5 heme-binding domain-containing protein [Trichoderma simmonsii]